MAGILSKGITLSYKTGSGSDYIELTNLQEIPELGGEAEAVEVTTLGDAAHMYINGILNYGDSLGFKFLYEKTQFATLQALKETASWKVELPDGEACTFDGVASVRLDGVGVNAALTYTLAVKPNSEMLWA
jgi:hypothetical protein